MLFPSALFDIKLSHTRRADFIIKDCLKITASFYYRDYIIWNPICYFSSIFFLFWDIYL